MPESGKGHNIAETRSEEKMTYQGNRIKILCTYPGFGGTGLDTHFLEVSPTMAQAIRKTPPILRHFRDLADPRIERKKLHLLSDIIVITICAVICGAEEWTEVALFGQSKMEWFKTFLSLPNGIPSHDTFGRVFARLDPEAFQRCFVRWMACVREKTEGEVVSLDGKTIRNSFDHASAKAAIHMVSAWGSANQCVLGQVQVDAKSNEITAVPRLLELLDISGCIVTMDAMGCQKEHARLILEKGGDYVFALKGNQGFFHAEVKAFFEDAKKMDFEDTPHQTASKTEKDHGRVETRRSYLVTDLSCIEKAAEWPGLKGIGMVESERKTAEGTSREVRLFATSLSSVDAFASAVRKHWQVENCLHWSLDVAFHEDKCRIRKDHGAANFAVIRHIALNQLKKERTVKNGIKGKRLKAGWDNDYLLKVLLS
jgi:predicted transposase YbfD/YdcC